MIKYGNTIIKHINYTLDMFKSRISYMLL